MKNAKIFLLLCGVVFLTAFCMENNSKTMNGTKKSLHQYVVENINGEEFDLSQLKGKKVMVVNTASKCGLTPQYEQLEALYKKYGSDNFSIIAFPSTLISVLGCCHGSPTNRDASPCVFNSDEGNTRY